MDVYTNWAGPCHAMTNVLKKIKNEMIKQEHLQYAIACMDTIPQLEMFKGTCKPIWLFFAGGLKKSFQYLVLCLK